MGRRRQHADNLRGRSGEVFVLIDERGELLETSSLAPAAIAPVLKSPPVASESNPPTMAWMRTFCGVPSSNLPRVKSPTALETAAASVLNRVALRISLPLAPVPKALPSSVDVVFCSAWLPANCMMPVVVLRGALMISRSPG